MSITSCASTSTTYLGPIFPPHQSPTAHQAAVCLLQLLQPVLQRTSITSSAPRSTILLETEFPPPAPSSTTHQATVRFLQLLKSVLECMCVANAAPRATLFLKTTSPPSPVPHHSPGHGSSPPAAPIGLGAHGCRAPASALCPAAAAAASHALGCRTAQSAVPAGCPPARKCGAAAAAAAPRTPVSWKWRGGGVRTGEARGGIERRPVWVAGWRA